MYCSAYLWSSFVMLGLFFVKQKRAYEVRISDWSSDVCSSDLGNVQVTIGSGKHLIRHQILMRIAGPPGRRARGHVIEILIGQHGDLAIEQRHIDVLAQATATALVQRGQYEIGRAHV